MEIKRYQFADLRDNDNDGIINQRDLCNDTPKDLSIDNSGCATWKPIDEISWFPIHFKFDSSKLQASQHAALNEAVEKLSKNRKIKLILIGDTSGEGSLEYNEKLAVRRNLAVKNYLLSWGVEKERVEVQVFDEPTPFTQHLKSRKRRTIAVFIEKTNVYQKDWTIFTTDQESQ